MKLHTMPPRLATLGLRVQPLTAKPEGYAERIRGRAGVSLRQQALERDKFVCVICFAADRITPAAVVDHVVPLWKRGSNELNNLQSLCAPCHDLKSAREAAQRAGASPRSDEAEYRRIPDTLQPARIPTTLVCGPPGSGKSTYVSTMAGPNDVVIDLDAIQQTMSGLPVHHTGKEWLVPSLEERNRQLHALADDTTHTRAWFIIGCPSRADRAKWRRLLQCDVVVLDVPLDQCARRIYADVTRKGQQQRMIEAAAAWWREQATPGGYE